MTDERATPPGRHRAAGAGGAGPDDGAEMVRSEEHAVTTITRQPFERVRLEKTVVEEEQVLTVRLRRELVRMVREPITESTALEDPPVAARATPWVTVSEEQAQVTVVVVPVERVRVVVDDVRSTEERDVVLRREQVDLIDPDAPRP